MNNEKNDIIQFISENLDRYPEINYNNSVKDQISIYSDHESGFDITLYSSKIKSILYLGDFHINFKHTNDEITVMIYLVFYSLTGKIKLEIFYKNKKPYQYNLHALNDNGDWYIYKTMKSMFYKFWQKTSSKFFQNQLVAEFL